MEPLDLGPRVLSTKRQWRDEDARLAGLRPSQWHPEEDCFQPPVMNEQGELFFPPATPAPKASSRDEAIMASAVVMASNLGDNVTLPQHYARFKLEPVRFICENGLNFFQGNIIKYTLRHDAKNGLEDLKKAKRYLEMFIKYTEGDRDWWK